MRQISSAIAPIALAFTLVACGPFPETVVWLKSVTFEVNAKANDVRPIVCHIVVPYSRDLKERIASMDAKTYFNNSARLEKEYRASIQVFKFDLIPGKDRINEKVDIRSYSSACGAYLFAKYSTPGKFMEEIGGSPIALIRCLPHKIEVKSISNMSEILNKK